MPLMLLGFWMFANVSAWGLVAGCYGSKLFVEADACDIIMTLAYLALVRNVTML